MNAVAEKRSSMNTSHPDPGGMVVKKKKNNESNTETFKTETAMTQNNKNYPDIMRK